MENSILSSEKFLTDFTQAYLATAAWATCEGGECTDFTKEAKLVAEKDCADFICKVIKVFGTNEAENILLTVGSDGGYLTAHDFFLTRDRHGAGFWDKESVYGENNATTLTEISHLFGSSDCGHIDGGDTELTFN